MSSVGNTSKQIITPLQFQNYCNSINCNNEINRLFIIGNYLSTHDVLPNGRTHEVVETIKETRRFKGQIGNAIRNQHAQSIICLSQMCADIAFETLTNLMIDKIPIVYGSRARTLSTEYQHNQEFMAEISNSVDWDVGYIDSELPNEEEIISILSEIEISPIHIEFNYEFEAQKAIIYVGSFSYRKNTSADITIYCEILANVYTEFGQFRCLVKRENILDVSRYNTNFDGLVYIDIGEHRFLPDRILMQNTICYALGLLDIIVKNQHSKDISLVNKAKKAISRFNLLNILISNDEIEHYKNRFTGLAELSIDCIQHIIN